MPSYHCHKQLVKPLQLELGARPHVRPEGRLHQANTATGQQVPRRPSHIGAVVHLDRRRETGKKVEIIIIISDNKSPSSISQTVS